jgi:glutamyl-tRNA reductase
MNSELKYVGITHERATVSQRSLFALNDEEQHRLRSQLMRRYSLKGLLFLFTCNRAEIYFESDEVSGSTIKHFILEWIQSIRKTDILPAELMVVYETTPQTAMHLFQVANGLRSAIPGDKQVIGQLRAAFRACLQCKNQGSILERCIQHVFRSHKQICNLLHPTQQKSLICTKIMNVLAQECPPDQEEIHLLMVGAGAMAREILPMFHKNKRFKIYVANRTPTKADQLSRTYHATKVDWRSVEANELNAFDVIITAVSHRKNLVKWVKPGKAKKVLIDLAMPANIASIVQSEEIVLYNIDRLYKQQGGVTKTRDRNRTLWYQLIKMESDAFFQWLDKKSKRLYEAA